MVTMTLPLGQATTTGCLWKCVFVCLLVQDALPMETTPLTVVSSEEQLLKLCDLLKTQSEIAVDTEVSNNNND